MGPERSRCAESRSTSQFGTRCSSAVSAILASMRANAAPRQKWTPLPKGHLMSTGNTECDGHEGYVDSHDEWQVADKRYLSETTLALLNPGNKSEHTVAAPAELTA